MKTQEMMNPTTMQFQILRHLKIYKKSQNKEKISNPNKMKMWMENLSKWNKDKKIANKIKINNNNKRKNPHTNNNKIYQFPNQKIQNLMKGQRETILK